MTTNMHEYLGLVPGDGQDPQSSAPAVSAPDPAAATTAALESLLLRFGLVSSDQLGEALREQAETGRPVGAIVVERGWVSAADVERLTGGSPVAPATTPAPVLAASSVPPAPAPFPAVPPAPAPFPAVPAFDALPEPPAPVFHVVEPVAEIPALPHVEPAVVEPEPAPAPEPVLAPVAPIVPFQGTFTPIDEPEAEPAPEHEPAPVVPLTTPEPEPAPAAVYTPFVADPEPTPPAVPFPTTARIPAPAQEQHNVKHVVIARLTTGERVEVNSYADRNAARAEAKALMAYLREGHPDWPFVHGRFIRPEAIVSIDLETVLLT